MPPIRESRIRLVPFTRRYLDRSWEWLNDPEIKALTLTSDFTRDEQEAFFVELDGRRDYLVWGVESADGEAVGACGLKNIAGHVAEQWCYIGARAWWGRGAGRQILEECEIKARLLNITNFFIRVSAVNTRSIGLYTHTGFVFDEARSDDAILYFTKSGI